MPLTKLHHPVRIATTGEITTIAALDDAGRIEWREVRTWKGATGYRAVLRDSIDPATPHLYSAWDVGKIAFQSRTAGCVSLARG